MEVTPGVVTEAQPSIASFFRGKTMNAKVSPATNEKPSKAVEGEDNAMDVDVNAYVKKSESYQNGTCSIHPFSAAM
jgi:hypothetical protein